MLFRSGREKGRHDKDLKLEKYQEKAASYKKKLRIALSNVQTLAQRVAQYEYQMVAERDDEAPEHAARRDDFNLMIRHLEDDDMQQQIKTLTEALEIEMQHVADLRELLDRTRKLAVEQDRKLLARGA